MPVTKYKLYSLYINNVQIDANHISSFQITLEQDPNNATLPVGVCEIGIKNNSSYTFSEHNKIVVTFSCSVSGTSNIIYNFYISKIDRSNDKEIAISGVDYIGLLDESNFEKAYKTPTAALSIISDILYDINGTYLSRISSDVNLTPVFEKMTKRQALQHVLFATGYRIRTNANQGNYDLEIYPESYESTAITVDDSVVYRGSSLVKNNEVNGVSITSHDYKLDDFGTVVVGEERFKDKSKVRNLSRTSDIENIITVSGAVCIQETRLNDVALRIYNDYQRYQDLNFDYVWCGEHIGKKLTIEAEDGVHTGFLKKLFLDVGLLSVVASGSMVLPNNNIVSPTDTETKSITSTGSITNEVTYSELVDLITNSKLVAGSKYTITDYVTIVDNYLGSYGKTYQVEAIQSAGHPFKIIVEAMGKNILKEDAYAEKIDNDSYFTNSKLHLWKIKYSIDNDTSKYQWASSLGKGVIYELIDEYGNKAPYDFKNIKYLRCKITGKSTLYSYLTPPSSVIGQYAGYVKIISWQQAKGYGPAMLTIDSTDYKFKYTFDYEGDDYSLSGNVSNNEIVGLSNGYELPNIVFALEELTYHNPAAVQDVKFERNASYITLGRVKLSSEYYTFSKRFYNLLFKRDCNSVIINCDAQDCEIKGNNIIISQDTYPYSEALLESKINGSYIYLSSDVHGSTIDGCEDICGGKTEYVVFRKASMLVYNEAYYWEAVGNCNVVFTYSPGQVHLFWQQASWSEYPSVDPVSGYHSQIYFQAGRIITYDN